MATPVRINEDNYADLQSEADTQRRSVVAQLNVILDARYGRSTVGNTPLLQKTEAPKPANPSFATENKIEATPVKVDDLFTAPGTVTEGNTLGEFDCCSHPSRPCKHWVWDADRGEGYKNILSGRFREAD